VATDEKDALEKTKSLLALLPTNNTEKAPVLATKDDPERLCPELDIIIPDKSTAPYNMQKVIKAIVDDGVFFETMALHATSVITGFGRFNGRTVGIFANQPMQAAGVITIDAADKGARFIRFCDLFNIPVVALGIVPVT
jgi:acetyl-CoA carboxylase carboxyltransferase component